MIILEFITFLSLLFCPCQENKNDLQVEYNLSEAIFLGHVIDIKLLKYNYPKSIFTYGTYSELLPYQVTNDIRLQEVTFVVEEVFKGKDISDTITIYSPLAFIHEINPSPCGFPFLESGSYLIFSYKDPSYELNFVEFWTDICTRSKPPVEKDLIALRKINKKE